VALDGTVYVATRTRLFAVEDGIPAKAPAAKAAGGS